MRLDEQASDRAESLGKPPIRRDPVLLWWQELPPLASALIAISATVDR